MDAGDRPGGGAGVLGRGDAVTAPGGVGGSDEGGAQGELPGLRGEGWAMRWQEYGLAKNLREVAHDNLQNVCRVLRRAPEVRGQWRYDALRDRVESRWRTPDAEWREWTRRDTVRLTEWLQGALGWPRLRVPTVEDATEVVAHETQIDPLREYVEGVRWDGTPRLEGWLARYWGVAPGEYAAAVGTHWLVGMVVRALEPGQQVQTMPVLCGAQGAGKSRGVRALGGAWFREATAHMRDKDFLQGLRGAWLVEIGEMGAMNGAPIEHAKALIAREQDAYRESYGRRVDSYRRRCVFVGTTNRRQVFEDATGGRRFWPVLVGRVDVAGIARDRDQLFAEARTRYEAGYDWWTTPAAETREAQDEARVAHPWEDIIARYITHEPQGALRPWPLTELSRDTILRTVLGLHADRLDARTARAVGDVMRALGWSYEQRRVPGSGGARERVYRLADPPSEAVPG